MTDDIVFNSVSDKPEKWRGLTELWDASRAVKTKTVGDFDLFWYPNGSDEEITAVDSNGVAGVLFYGHEAGPDSPLRGAVEVRPDVRRRGLATAMYTWAEELSGGTFVPDTPHTPLAEAFWRQKDRPFGQRKSSLPTLWRVAYGAGGKTVDLDPEQKPRNNDKLESQDIIGPFTDNYDTSDTLFTDHNQGREFEREGGRVFDVPVAQLSLRADNPIFEDQVERYIAEPNLDPIEVSQAVVEPDDDIEFVDGHTPLVGETYWVINNGHHRALAAFRQGIATIPARRIDILSKDELRAYGNPNFLPVEPDDDGHTAAVENLHSLDEGVGPKELSLPEEWSKAYESDTTGIHLGQARMRGYKIMAVSPDGKSLVSMADSRQTFPLELGPMAMPGKGVFLSPNKQYVLEYYSGHNDHEALLTFEFDPRDITSGNLTDRESEVSVSRAEVVEIELLGELARTAGRLWYHGDQSQRLGFADQRMQNEANWNAMGPGIYFTSDKQQALGYAGASGYVYTAEVGGKIATEEQTPTVKEIRKFLSMLDEEGRTYLFSNWDGDSQRAQRKVEQQYTQMDFVSAFADLGRQGGTDYGESGRQWTAMMVQLGYAGVLHKLPEVEHLIVWDPNAITVKAEEAAADLRATKEAARLEAPPAMMKAGTAVIEGALRTLSKREVGQRLRFITEIQPTEVQHAEAELTSVAEAIEGLRASDTVAFDLPRLGLASAESKIEVWLRPAWASRPNQYDVYERVDQTPSAKQNHTTAAEAIADVQTRLRDAVATAQKVHELLVTDVEPMQAFVAELGEDGPLEVKLPVDLTGSRYETRLVGADLPKTITLRVGTQRGEKDVRGDEYGGFWQASTQLLVVLVTQGPTDVATFDRILAQAKVTLEHELVHVMQTLLSIAADVTAGNPAGREDPRWGTEHERRLVEFYPNLVNEVTAFESAFAARSHYSKQDRSQAAREWVNNRQRFTSLKDYDPPRWEKMVKEFMRAVVPAEAPRAREPGALLERQEHKKRIREEEKANQAAVPDATIGQLLQRGYALNRSEFRDAGFPTWRDWVSQQSAEQLAMVLENESELYGDTISKFPRDSNGDSPDLVALIERWRNRRAAAAVAAFELSPDEIVPLHEHYSQRHVDELHVAMTDHGWVGRPILVLAYDTGFRALTGTHRLRAARLAGLQVPVVAIDGDEVPARVATALIDADGDHERLEIARTMLPEAVPYLEAELGDDRQAAHKLPLLEQCDRLRLGYEGGEAFWGSMMQQAEPIDREAFAAAVDPSRLLDDGETLDEFTADDPTSGTFRSQVDGQPVYFLQTRGFEFIFADPSVRTLWGPRRAALEIGSAEYQELLADLAADLFVGTERYGDPRIVLDRIPRDVAESALRRLPREQVVADLTALVEEMLAGRTAGAVAPDAATPSDPGYVYHATNEERARSIASEGLLPHKPWEFTDQDTWPDGKRGPRVYFAPKAGSTWAFAPPEGKAVLLRAPDSVVTGRDGTGDVFSTKPVPASMLEILTDAGWVPLTSSWEGETHEGFALIDTTDSGNDFQDLLPSVRRDRSIARPPDLEEVLYG